MLFVVAVVSFIFGIFAPKAIESLVEFLEPTSPNFNSVEGIKVTKQYNSIKELMLDFDNIITVDIVGSFGWRPSATKIDKENIKTWIEHAILPRDSVTRQVQCILDAYEYLCCVKNTDGLDNDTVEIINVAKRVNTNIVAFQDLKRMQKEAKILEQVNKNR